MVLIKGMLEFLFLTIMISVLIMAMQSDKGQAEVNTSKKEKKCPLHTWEPQNNTTHSYRCSTCKKTPSDPSLDL